MRLFILSFRFSFITWPKVHKGGYSNYAPNAVFEILEHNCIWQYHLWAYLFLWRFTALCFKIFLCIYTLNKTEAAILICFLFKVYTKINNIKTVDLRSTVGIICSAHFRNVTGVFTEERQLESLWSGVIRVVPLRHPVPLVVMVICQQETEYRVQRHTAVFVLAVVL